MRLADTPTMRAGPRGPRSLRFGLLAFQGTLLAATAYLLGLLLAARLGAGRRPADPPATAPARSRLVVLIPAHDEEEGIEATLRSLARCDYPAAALRAVVIADNCSDRTAELAREQGVEAWERRDARRGKGQALIWALARLAEDDDPFDAVVVLDADCIASPNLLSAIDLRLGRGAGAVQVSYVVGNPSASHASALRFGAFALMNTVRFAGKQRLGLSCGLAGTGMALSRELLRIEPWSTTGLVEDGEYHMRLVLAGARVEFAAEASVSSPMPTSARGANAQQARWEQGKIELIRTWSPRLLRAGLAHRDPVRLHAGLECLVPPQSLIVAGGAGSALAGLLLGSRRLLALALASLVGQIAFVLGGLRFAGAPAAVYRALPTAPALVAGKVALYARLLGGRGPTAWVRTEREPAPVPQEVR